MRLAVVAAAIIVTAVPAVAQFKIDISRDEMRRLVPAPAIVDLAVGEVGITAYPRFCTDQGSLYIWGYQELYEDISSYSMNFRVLREPGGSVALTTEPGADHADPLRATFATLFTNPTLCTSGGLLMEEYVPVSSIDGSTSLSQVFR